MRRSDVVFFLSGSAALVYQVAWSRLLARLTGSDAIGVSLVLAVFMAGMGAGALVLANVARRARDPRRTFAAIVGVLGLWAALSPYALAELDPVQSLPGRAGIALFVLLVPTALMGSTFPLMGRLTITGDGEAGRSVSGFYGANTLGASLGALLAPFVLLPALGLRHTLLAGAALDVAAGILALALPLRLAPSGDAPAVRPRAGRPASPSLAAPLAMASLFGASSLALEVLMTRVLVTVTGASVYAFAIVLAVFLLGLGLGSRQAAGWLASERSSQDLARRCALVTPVVGMLGLIALRWQLGESDLFGPLSNRLPKDAATPVLWISHALFAGLALFPPAVGFGMALPACTAIAVARRGDRGRETVLGRVYALNTLGATLGSLLGGFALLPLFGPRVGVALSLGVCFAAALCACSAESARTWARELVAAGALCAVFGALALARGESTREGQVLHHVTGRDSTVTVVETPGLEEGSPSVRALRVDGKVVATTAPVDLRQQRFLGIVPGLLQGAPESALVIGLGTGMTAGSLLAFPSLAELRVYEISSAVVEGAAFFAEWNERLLEDPRTRIEIVDGRHALALDSRFYDVVTSDPIHPWTRGSSNLYALEHFQHMALRLAPGGVASQWLPLYQLETEDVHTVIATWCAAFPRVSAWLTAYDLVLVGAVDSIEPMEHGLGAIVLPERVRALLAAAGVHSSLELAALEIADDPVLRALATGTSPMTEDRPRLEYRAPLSYMAGYSVGMLTWAAGRPPPPGLSPYARERAIAIRDLLGNFLAELPSGLSRAAERYGREILALEPLTSP